jgi:hypothetical protein
VYEFARFAWERTVSPRCGVFTHLSPRTDWTHLEAAIATRSVAILRFHVCDVGMDLFFF